MAAVIVPPRAGVLSAVGLLCSPRQREVVRSWPDPADHDGLDEALAALGAEAMAAVATAPRPVLAFLSSEAELRNAGSSDPGVEVEFALDCRYRGQSHELSVPSVEAFHAEHERRNGYARPEAPVEVVALRARARPSGAARAGGSARAGPAALHGPTVAVEQDCTVWIPAGWVRRTRARSAPGS